MDEEEMIRRIRNSLKSGVSEAEITRRLQGEGYRLEYILALLKKARGRRWIFAFLVVSFLIIVILIIVAGIVGYTLFLRSPSVENKALVSNPLDGLKINFNSKPASGTNGSLVSDNGSSTDEENDSGDGLEEVYIGDVEITTEFISYLLNELGAWKLRANPLTGELPLINFEIENQSFNSVVIDNQITSEEGLADEPDLIFVSNKVDIVKAMLSDAPEDVFRESYNDGRSSVVLEKPETELFTKGYVPLYDSLSEP